MRSWTCVIALVFVCSLGLFVEPGLAESRITDVSADASGCGIALNDNGTIWLWGTVATNDDTGLQPIIMPGVDHVVAVTGQMYPVVLKDDGTVWLIKNYPYFENPEKFKGSTGYGLVKVDGLDHIIAIDGNNQNLLALKDDGTVWAMGSNMYGQRGMEEGYGAIDYEGPLVNQVQGLSDVIAISEGDSHALALKKDGTVWAWGMNNMGQLGDGTTTYDQWEEISPDGKPYLTTCPGGKSTPVMVKGLTGATAIAGGTEFSMALKDDGTVWAWGRNSFGMLGDGVPGNIETQRTTPVQVVGLANVMSIDAGRWFALALRDDGTVWAWGDNRICGMLGDGTLENRNVPTQVKGLSGISSISAGNTNNYALDKYGIVWGWGDNSAGQLGDGQHGANVYRATADKVPFTEALAGPEISPGWMARPYPPISVNPPIQDNPIEYMAVAGDHILAFSRNNLAAMDANGTPEWNLTIPGAWTYSQAYDIITDPHVKAIRTDTINGVTTTVVDENSMMAMSVKAVPIFTSEDGYVYLYAFSDAVDSKFQPMDRKSYLNGSNYLAGKDLIAVAPDGKIEWTHHFVDDIAIQDNAHLEAHGDRIYLYNGYNETVFDTSGKVLFTIENISNPVSVDEDGNMYAVEAVKVMRHWLSSFVDGVYFDYRTPSNVVEAYTPDGKQSWRKVLDANIAFSYFLPVVWNGEIGIPLYHDGVLYVPQDGGVTALNKDGSLRWAKNITGEYRVFYLMPMDSKGDLYLYSRNDDGSQTVMVIGPDGTVIARADAGQSYVACASNGVLYKDNKPMAERDMVPTKDSLEMGEVAAYDLLQGKYLWNFTTPIGQSTTVVLNESNVLTLFPDRIATGLSSGTIYYEHSNAQVIPAGNATYVYFRTAVKDNPIIYNQSTCTYYSALYALDKTGKLVWQKPMDSFLTAAAANNTTIYYGTNGGSISIETIGVVAGVAIVGSLLAFFLLGSVTRARSRIDKNENRNRINKFIIDRPGSTLYELSKVLGMNIGTLRYHLMILGLNHRTVTYNDGKFVRYFANSNTYSNEDKMVISLVRRESMGKLLKAVMDSGEVTNDELCEKLGLPESGISKYLSELSDKGIVTKTGQGTRVYYSIRELHRERLSKALTLMDNRVETVKNEGMLPDQAETYG
ncbi:hypothetical protein MCP_0750 [Methanocella paludicola SANAE]|uniref:HTH arsR-type domain-containing protein n=1 Tax=Methanocella paludicola (strain DSM 17711 / JCM 13418 / NBRC 101707 / SANAE) TaxID=304371 RepID=D1YWK0_METPS|nr:winged helix-turn-helix transcriptional regulator [Methanocella paludicola]BAI60822.1 hypothetical protein MCP_0750 [Methanocella paludicola SANAE]